MQVTPFSSAHAWHSGSMALAVLAELSAQTTRVESPAGADDSLSASPLLSAVGVDESLPPHAVSTIASALSATPALSVRPLVLRMRILHPSVGLANLKVQPDRCPESHHGGL